MRHLGALFLLIAACGGSGGSVPPGGGGGPGPGPGPDPLPQTVEESLQALGVNLASGPRLDAQGQALPEDWMPLGPAYRVNRMDELLEAGGDYARVYEGRFGLLKNLDAEPWTASYLTRATAAGDFDGDGRDELLVVTGDPEEISVSAHLHDDAVQGYASLASAEIASLPDDARRLAAIAGDFDGDGDAEAAVAMVRNDGAGDGIDILFLDYEAGAFQQIGRSIAIAPQAVGGFYLSFAVGQIDADPAEELAYVVNEYFTPEPTFATGYRDGKTRYAVLDDLATDFAEIAGGDVGANVSGVLRTAKSSAVALADIDADGFDEIVLGGMTRIGSPDDSPGTSMGYLLYALDDPAAGFADLGGHFQPYTNPNTQDGGAAHWLEYVPVDAADLDGDTVPEIRIAHLLLSWQEGAWDPVGTLPFDQVMFPDSPVKVHVNQEKTLHAVGRFVAPTRDNILTFSQELDSNLRVWGMVGGLPAREDMKPANGFVECLQPADVDADTLALEYVPGSHDLVFTEPVIIAALAAAPGGVGQDPDDCRTQFGVSDSSGTETEEALTMTAGVIVGIAYDANIPWFPLGAEATYTMSETVEHTTARAYEVTQTVVWETGPIEDSVIFTSIPYDRYRYRVLETGGNDDLRDREIVVSIPRRPVHLMVSRDFYDAHVLEGTPTVAPALPHTEGDPSSYYTFAQAMSLVQAHGGIASDPQDVGEGSGNVSVTLEVGEAFTEGTSIAASWSGEVRVTAAGAVGGFTVGESRTDAVRMTTGRRLIYGGTVGQIDAAHFAENAYSFGIFAYPREDEGSGRAYQVVNYWVTPLN